VPAPSNSATRKPAKKAAASAPAPTRAKKAAVSYASMPWLAQYVEGIPAKYEFPKFALTRILDDATSSFPDHVALAFLGAKTTYKELKTQVDAFAGALAGLGVTKGDRVALVLPNCPQNVIAFFATLRLGAVVVEHNPLYTEAELTHQLADCGAKVVVCLDRVYATVAKVQKNTSVEHVITTSLIDFLPKADQLKLRLPVKKAKKQRAEISAVIPKTAGVKDFAKLLKDATPISRQEPVLADDLALLQYTGGTTGLSKGAMLSHRNLVSNAYMNRLWDTEAKAGKEVTLAVLPLFHAYGLTVAMTNTILLGGTLVLLPRFDLDLVFAAIDTWKPTLFPGVPPIYKAIADSPKAKAHDLKSIRLCVSGAMKLPTEIKEQFTKISGAVLIEGYGMTETSPSTHANPTKGPGKPGSIGLPLPGTLCKIVDQENSATLVPVGQPGELAIAGPQVFSGYWGREDQDGVFTDDGYVLTGDVAVMDEDGYFFIVDRKKELIIAGGFNIYPSEVEEVLFGLDGVADVVVIGVPDKYRGETVKAFVVKAPGSTITEDDVVAACATSLTAYKVPKLVEFRTELPRTAVGKVLRRVLVEEERVKASGSAPAKPASVPSSAPKAKAAAEPSPAVTKAPAKRAAAKPPVAKAPVAKAPVAKAPVAKKAAAPAKKAPAPANAPAKKAPAPAKKAPAAAKAPAKKAPAPAKKAPAAAKAAAKKAPAPAKAPAKKAPAPAKKAPAAAKAAAKKAPAPVKATPVAAKAPAPAKAAAKKAPAAVKALVKKAPAKNA
jgi:long-chain acyl-CoA synthetase